MTKNILKKTALLLLSGGKGTRMQSAQPKQYLQLGEKPIALHSFEIFSSLPFAQVIVVCEESYQFLFPNVTFAKPGKRRQDSVASGLKKIAPGIEYICIHDAARPFVTEKMILTCLEDASRHGASAVAIPVTATLRRATQKGTVDRENLHAMQTPQCVRLSLLQEGLKKAEEESITLTDDLAAAELTGADTHLTLGSPKNLKITTPDDLILAESILNR